MGDLQHRVSLHLLGCDVLVRCAHRACAMGIARHFAPRVCESWCTPDVVVDCDWDAAGRYLFRSRPDAEGPLEGVRVHAPGAPADSDWPFAAPPIPPFPIDPFRARFYGLHAGAVAGPDGQCLLLPGERRSGKTTCVSELVNRHGWRLLTDETAVLHRRTLLLEPFPQEMGMWGPDGSGEGKHLVPADRACVAIAERPHLVTCIVALSIDPAADVARVGEVSSAQALRELLRHHLDVGSTADEGMVSLAQMARRVPAFRAQYRTYEELLSLVPTLDRLGRATRPEGGGAARASADAPSSLRSSPEGRAGRGSTG